MTMKINLKGYFEKVKLLNLYLIRFESDIDVSIDHYTVDGKSLFGLLSLNFARDLKIDIREKYKGEALRIRDYMRDNGFLVEG